MIVLTIGARDWRLTMTRLTRRRDRPCFSADWNHVMHLCLEVRLGEVGRGRGDISRGWVS